MKFSGSEQDCRGTAGNQQQAGNGLRARERRLAIADTLQLALDITAECEYDSDEEVSSEGGSFGDLSELLDSLERQVSASMRSLAPAQRRRRSKSPTKQKVSKNYF